MHGKKTLLTLLVMTLIAGLAFVATGSAQAATTKHTVAQAEAYTKGKYYGPTSYSDFGRATITGFTSYIDCTTHKTFYQPMLTLKQYPNPAALTVGTKTVTRPALTCQQTTFVLASWYNPFSWDWGSIMGNFWNDILSKCATGAIKGVIGTASGTLIVNMLIRGAKIYVGPEGYAVLAIGGCVANMLF